MEALNGFVQAYPVQIFAAFGLVIFLGGILNLLVWAKVRKISRLSRDYFEGKDGKDLEALISRNEQGLKKMDADIQELYVISNKINALAQRSLHRVGVLRFNPFKDIGGDQSFSVALLDGKNSGITFSSLHTREGTRVYVKPIVRGKSEKYTLTEEESQVVQMAANPKNEKNNL